MWEEGESWVCGEGRWGGDPDALPRFAYNFNEDVTCWRRYIFGIYPEKGRYFWGVLTIYLS